jgi:intracellular sulfur oxidation DsrE/DsrF family protein
MWTRRGLAASGFLAAYGLIRTPAAAAPAQALQVVYHLNELERVGLVLRCIHNHYAGMGDEPVAIALVIHGSALRAFWQTSASLDFVDVFTDLAEKGLTPYACSNTLRAQGKTHADLLEGFDPAECVGVVKLANLQAEGFAYIHP